MSEQFTAATDRDLRILALGKELGRGISRRVHVLDFYPAHVAKIEEGGSSFQNVAEWQIWQAIGATELGKWFAPCHAISPNGSVLIQTRTEDVTAFPLSVPAFFGDLKLANFGRIGRRFVARDYGNLTVRLFYLATRRRVPMMRVLRTDADGWAVTART